MKRTVSESVLTILYFGQCMSSHLATQPNLPGGSRGHADVGDSVMTAQVQLEQVDEDLQIEEVVDKGDHAAATIEHCDAVQLRTYIPQRQRKCNAHWIDKPAEYERCVTNNRRRIQCPKSKQFQRQRSELCERSFAHVCETGGQRRSWLRGLVDVSKRSLIAVAGHNLIQILRKLFGIGKPRRLQGGVAAMATLAARSKACSRFPNWYPKPRATPETSLTVSKLAPGNNSIGRYQIP